MSIVKNVYWCETDYEDDDGDWLDDDDGDWDDNDEHPSEPPDILDPEPWDKPLPGDKPVPQDEGEKGMQALQERTQTLMERMEEVVKRCDDVEQNLDVIAKAVGCAIVTGGPDLSPVRGLLPPPDNLKQKIEAVNLALQRISEHTAIIRDVI